MHDNRPTRLILGVLLVAALALITFDSRGGTASPVRGLRAFGGTVFGSAESLVSAVVRPVTGLFGNVTNGPARQGQIADLQRQVAQLRSDLSRAQLSRSQEAQLQSLLQLSGRGGYRIVAASVVAAGPPYENTVTIDAGRMDGIAPNETVLNGNGLVGTVTSVSTRTSTVLLTTDASSTVGVRVAGTGEIGAVTGAGAARPGPVLLRLQVFDANAVLRAGQQLVTFGSVHGRPYVAGVPVGVITRVVVNPSALTKLAFVRPYADDNALGVIGVVVVPPRKNPRDSVLPPGPSPSPSTSPPHRRGGASPSPTPTASTTTGG